MPTILQTRVLDEYLEGFESMLKDVPLLDTDKVLSLREKAAFFTLYKMLEVDEIFLRMMIYITQKYSCHTQRGDVLEVCKKIIAIMEE